VSSGAVRARCESSYETVQTGEQEHAEGTEKRENLENRNAGLRRKPPLVSNRAFGKMARCFVTNLPYRHVSLMNSKPFGTAFGRLAHDIVRGKQPRRQQAMGYASVPIAVPLGFSPAEQFRNALRRGPRAGGSDSVNTD
jgi:hypothetical protein